mgnify:CR=1 FL=1
MRAASDAKGSDILQFLKTGFTNAAMANVSKSALEAKAMGYQLSAREEEIAKANGNKLPWVVGTVANVVDPSAGFIQTGAENSLPVKAGTNQEWYGALMHWSPAALSVHCPDLPAAASDAVMKAMSTHNAAPERASRVPSRRVQRL